MAHTLHRSVDALEMQLRTLGGKCNSNVRHFIEELDRERDATGRFDANLGTPCLIRAAFVLFIAHCIGSKHRSVKYESPISRPKKHRLRIVSLGAEQHRVVDAKKLNPFRMTAIGQSQFACHHYAGYAVAVPHAVGSDPTLV